MSAPVTENEEVPFLDMSLLIEGDVQCLSSSHERSDESAEQSAVSSVSETNVTTK